MLAGLAAGLAPAAAMAEDLSAGDTAWMLTATALVLFMTIPGLSLFYAGMVRSKNVLSVLMQCFAITGLMSILWAFWGYSIAFDEGNAFMGGFGKLFLTGVTVDAMSGTIPETVFMTFQMTFAVITPALIVGAFAERMKFSAMLWFMGIWMTVVYAPITHWVWGGGCEGHWPMDEGWGRGDQPVVNVSWHDAQNYAAWLSARTGEQYRLPTESEWEYAARAGSTTKYSWGDEVGEGLANCGGCGLAWNDRRHSVPVGSFDPNAWGLYDMHGNVWEWVQDTYQLGYDRAPKDGSAAAFGEDSGSEPVHVLRGGSWISSPKYLRSAYRFRYAPDSRYFIAGFRMARTRAPDSPSS